LRLRVRKCVWLCVCVCECVCACVSVCEGRGAAWLTRLGCWWRLGMGGAGSAKLTDTRPRASSGVGRRVGWVQVGVHGKALQGPRSQLRSSDHRAPVRTRPLTIGGPCRRSPRRGTTRRTDGTAGWGTHTHTHTHTHNGTMEKKAPTSEDRRRYTKIIASSSGRRHPTQSHSPS
jgi:hypothetical protein